MRQIGFQSLITLVVQFGFIWLAFRSLQGLRLDHLFRKPPKTLPTLIVLLSVAIGYSCASFVVSFFNTISNLIYLTK
ncbi:DUF1146 domain-containing protein [Paucilactobacillus sp. N302-9]|jgi:uncharacterized membrane protein YwzB